MIYVYKIGKIISNKLEKNRKDECYATSCESYEQLVLQNALWKMSAVFVLFYCHQVVWKHS